jgi:hypothetical protein
MTDHEAPPEENDLGLALMCDLCAATHSATFYCVQCKYRLCDAMAQVHREAKSTHTHTVNPLRDATQSVSWKSFRVLVSSYVLGSRWNQFSIAVNFLNTLLLAMTFEGQEESYGHVIVLLDDVCSYFFIIETFLLICVMGFWKYWSVFSLMFDGVISLINIVQFALPPSKITVALRALTVLRVLKHFRSWKALTPLFKGLYESLSDLAYFMVTMALILFVMSLVGFKLFRGMSVNGVVPRSNFESFGYAMLTSFQCMTAENFNSILSDVRNYQQGYAGTIYILIMMIIGHYIIEPLFLVLLATNVQVKKKKTVHVGFLFKVPPDGWWGELLYFQQKHLRICIFLIFIRLECEL